MSTSYETEAHKRWRDANPERVREYKQRWYAANRERQIEIHQRWRDANPERIRAYNRSEEKRATTRAWNAAHPERIREYMRAWRRRKAAIARGEVVEATRTRQASRQAAPTREAEAEANREPQVSLCAHCSGQIIAHWDELVCLQCGRAPVAARVLTPEEEPSYKADGVVRRRARHSVLDKPAR